MYNVPLATENRRSGTFVNLEKNLITNTDIKIY